MKFQSEFLQSSNRSTLWSLCSMAEQTKRLTQLSMVYLWKGLTSRSTCQGYPDHTGAPFYSRIQKPRASSHFSFRLASINPRIWSESGQRPCICKRLDNWSRSSISWNPLPCSLASDRTCHEKTQQLASSIPTSHYGSCETNVVHSDILKFQAYTSTIPSKETITVSTSRKHTKTNITCPLRARYTTRKTLFRAWRLAHMQISCWTASHWLSKAWRFPKV